MPQRHREPYPPEFRRKIVELVRAGRSPEELAQEFEPTAMTIRTWVKRVQIDAGERNDGLTTAEREELRRLRRENKTLRMEREILKKAAADSIDQHNTRPIIISGGVAEWFNWGGPGCPRKRKQNSGGVGSRANP